TSDALALAVRIGCPIYTYENILDAAGMFQNSEQAHTAMSAGSEETEEESDEDTSDASGRANLKNHTLQELEELLQQVLEKEDYIQAIAIRDEIKNREEKGK